MKLPRRRFLHLTAVSRGAFAQTWWPIIKACNFKVE